TGQVEIGQSQRRRRRLGGGKLRKVVDHPPETEYLVVQAGQPGWVRLGEAVPELLERSLECGEGSTKLVRDVRRLPAASLLRGGDLVRHAVEGRRDLPKLARGADAYSRGPV